MINKDGTVVTGVKGKSGRKSAHYEMLKKEVIDKAWRKLNKEIDKKDVEKIALPIALRDMVTKVGNPDGSKIEPIKIYGGQSLRGHSGHETDILPNQEN